MIVGVLRLELILHAPHSLKEKRGIVKRILARCRSKFPVSGAETDMQDLWQRSFMGFSMVGTDEAAIRAVFLAIEEEICRSGLAEVIGQESEIFHY